MPTVLIRQFNLTELNWRRFGPKLVSWDDSDGITYSLRLLPLGGYVSFPEATGPPPPLPPLRLPDTSGPPPTTTSHRSPLLPHFSPIATLAHRRLRLLPRGHLFPPDQTTAAPSPFFGLHAPSPLVPSTLTPGHSHFDP